MNDLEWIRDMLDEYNVPHDNVTAMAGDQEVREPMTLLERLEGVLMKTQPCESGCPDTRMHYEGCSEHDPDSCVVCLRNAALETAAEVADDVGATYIAKCIRNLKEDL